MEPSRRGAAGGGRLDLPARDRLYARPHDLAEVGGLKDHERGERHPVLWDRQLQELRNDEPDPEDHHDQRDAADEFDIERRRHADPTRARQAGESDEDPDRESEPDRRNRQAERASPEAAHPEQPLDDQELEVRDDDAEVEHAQPPRAIRPGIAKRRSTRVMMAAIPRHSTR